MAVIGVPKVLPVFELEARQVNGHSLKANNFQRHRSKEVLIDWPKKITFVIANRYWKRSGYSYTIDVFEV